jgi:4-hydroxy-tetrahydrodipicolinate synthase
LSKFRGALTALITPFDDKDKIDEEGLRENVRFQIEQGIHGLVPVGTTGECATLSYEEHERVIDIVIDETKGKVPVVAGTGSNSTKEAITLTKYAKDAGADGALLVAPYYNKPGQRGLYEHYKKIAEEVDIPQVIYNIPSRTGINVEAETIAKLSKIKNIIGVKEASGNLSQIMQIIKQTDEDFSLISGDDSLTFPILALGGVGVISVAANLVPDKVAKMVDAFLEGDIETSRNLHYELMPLFKVLFIETNPGPVKAAMELLGRAAGKPRLPLLEAHPETREKLREVLADLGLVSK